MHKKQGFALPSRTPAGKTCRISDESKVMAATGAEKSRKFGGKQRPCRASRPRDYRRRVLRRLQPRPLRDRRLVLPDPARSAWWFPGPWTRRCKALAIAPGRGRDRHPARRRHIAMRPDRQRWNRRRFFQAPEPDPLARRRKPDLRGRARHRARRPQPPAQKARAVVSGRRFHRLARHHRRHGRQQFLRRPFAALRHHARQHAVDGCGAGRRHAACISARCRGIWRR